MLVCWLANQQGPEQNERAARFPVEVSLSYVPIFPASSKKVALNGLQPKSQKAINPDQR